MLNNQASQICYERAQPSTGTRVLEAGLGPIGPSASLPSVGKIGSLQILN